MKIQLNTNTKEIIVLEDIDFDVLQKELVSLLGAEVVRNYRLIISLPSCSCSGLG